MEYDHLVIPGMNYRRSKEDIMKEVKADADEWRQKELDARIKAGATKEDALKRLEPDTRKWIELEFQRRMNWNYEEEGTDPL